MAGAPSSGLGPIAKKASASSVTPQSITLRAPCRRASAARPAAGAVAVYVSDTVKNSRPITPSLTWSRVPNAGSSVGSRNAYAEFAATQMPATTITPERRVTRRRARSPPGAPSSPWPPTPVLTRASGGTNLCSTPITASGSSPITTNGARKPPNMKNQPPSGGPIMKPSPVTVSDTPRYRLSLSGKSAAVSEYDAV